MTDEKPVVKTEVVVATEPAGSDQKKLGRPMLMLLVLIGAALAGIGIMVLMRSN